MARIATRAALLTAIAVSALLAPPVALGHGGAAQGVDERQLRQIERRLLGSGHATDHAAQRRVGTRRPARAERRDT
ncbi:MAG: hypothetical protein H0U79_05925, partial [Solirubrobacterales bacterium]|nr:hypothetical protein [Solirubrobacterales bacterium]